MLGGTRHNMAALMLGLMGASMGGSGFEAREARREAEETKRSSDIDSRGYKPAALCHREGTPAEVEAIRAQRKARKLAAFLKRQPKS